MSSGVAHPYIPRELVIPNYVSNDIDLVPMLVVFFGVLAASLGIMWLYMSNVSHLKGATGTKLKIIWFLSCGLIHTILEGYFAFHHKTIVEEKTFLGQLWKEYGKADSRYVTSDTFVICMETITAVIDGPLSLWAVYAFIRKSPYRYIVQLTVSLLQLYGDVLYFGTEYVEDFSHGYYMHPLYFWFYFFFMNILWIIFPLMLVFDSFNGLSRAQAVTDRRPISSDKRK